MMKNLADCVGIASSKGKNKYIQSGSMIPRTVQMAKAVDAVFTTPQLEAYGNIILNGYLETAAAVSTAGRVGAINTVTFTAGSGYTNGTYAGLYLGGSVGSFGYATVTVAGGLVTAVAITAGGNNFYVGQVLTLGNIPRTTTGTNATITVASVNVTQVRPALKGWTTNYAEYYTQLGPVPGYDTTSGDPTMFEYDVHSFSQASGPLTAIGSLQGGQGYIPGIYVNVATQGGSGTGATLDITVGAGGTVTSVTLNAPGSDYTVGDGLTSTAIGSGYGFAVFVTGITVVNPAGEPRWAQAPRRFFQNQVANFVPPNANQQAIQYSFMYPVADNPVPPPVDVL